ncbi:hypothetical protein BCV70DRAFT_200111 [Testicularia cyperi]|uniref:Secreted protein n=1 Tax=Testicularia cyperi TaxID=1882483 RepID=A0A317XNT2_9BASI|nr:hypothetical protein BCV70DRAFT_200111 [Testicularia cyperi]
MRRGSRWFYAHFLTPLLSYNCTANFPVQCFGGTHARFDASSYSTVHLGPRFHFRSTVRLNFLPRLSPSPKSAQQAGVCNTVQFDATMLAFPA